MPAQENSAHKKGQRAVLVGLASFGGAVAFVAPTGIVPLDIAWSALFAGAFAYLGGYAGRTVVLIAAGAAALMAGSVPSIVLSALAVIVALVDARRRRGSIRLGTAAGGLVALALLTTTSTVSAVLTAGGVATVSTLLLVAGWQRMSARRRHGIRRWAVWGLGAVGVCAAAGGVAAVMSLQSARRGMEALAAATASGGGGDLRTSIADAADAQRSFHSARGPLGGFGRVGRVVPGLGLQLKAAQDAVSTAEEAATALAANAGQIDLDAVGFAGGRVDLAAVGATGGPLRALVADIHIARERLGDIDRRWLVPSVSKAISDAIGSAEAAATTAHNVERAVALAPELLGANGPRRYLVFFTTPVEARNRFGFPGAYAVVGFDQGKIHYERGGSIADLVFSQRPFDQARLAVGDRIGPYEQYGITREWRSTTIPPDGPAVTDLMVQLARQSRIGAVDGVVLADPFAVAEIVDLVGGVPLAEIASTLTRENTVDFLTRRQYVEFPELGQQGDRKELLGEVAEVVGSRLEQLSLPSIRRLGASFAPLVNSGRLVVGVAAGANPALSELLADVHLDGAFPGGPASDVVLVGQRNNGGNKIDLFLSRRLSYAVKIDDRGVVRARLTIALHNAAPASGLPFYLIGAVAPSPPPPGTNRGTVLIYSPFRVERVSVDGDPVDPVAVQDGPLAVSQLQLDIGPGQERTIVADLVGQAPPGPYRLRAFPGGLLAPDRLDIDVRDARSDGHEIQALTLTAPVCIAPGAVGRVCR